MLHVLDILHEVHLLLSKSFEFHLSNFVKYLALNTLCGIYTAVVKINFFNNLPVGQVITNIYLPKEISTCPNRNGRVHFYAV